MLIASIRRTFENMLNFFPITAESTEGSAMLMRGKSQTYRTGLLNPAVYDRKQGRRPKDKMTPARQVIDLPRTGMP
jgi:hypothetical protein